MKYRVLIEAEVTAADMQCAITALYPALHPRDPYFGSNVMVRLPLRIVRTEELPEPAKDATAPAGG